MLFSDILLRILILRGKRIDKTASFWYNTNS